MKKIALLFFLLLFTQVQAQPRTYSAADIRNGLKKLNTVGSVLYIAAHPDDENTRLISYLTGALHYRTGYLSLTRGDGGQNLIGEEQGRDLGIIRTQELLAARRIDGAEQFFTRAFDFGYSKNPAETFREWNKEEVLRDVVWVIRKFQPDIIICRFPTTGEGGHGHHTASAILAREAFHAAADPAKYPDQLQWVPLWKTERLLWNTFNFGSANTISEDQFKIDVGGYDPLSGKSYGETAAESRSQHRSQAFGTERRRGSQLEYFTTLEGKAPVHQLTDGIRTGWTRFSQSAFVGKEIEKIQAAFSDENPSQSVPALIKLYRSLQKTTSPEPGFSTWKSLKLEAIRELVAQCAGLYIEALSPLPYLTPGDSTVLQLSLINRSGLTVEWTQTDFGEFAENTVRPAASNVLLQKKLPFLLPVATPVSMPYGSLDPEALGFRENAEAPLHAYPEYREETKVHFSVKIAGETFRYTRPLAYKYVDPSRGEVYQPVVVAPPVAARAEGEALVFFPGVARTLKVQVKNFGTATEARVRLQLPEGWKSEPAFHTLTFLAQGDEKEVTFQLTAPESTVNRVTSLRIVTECGAQTYEYGWKTLQYEHIPAQLLFPPSTLRAVVTDVKRTTTRIGYIAGAGDKIPALLRELGYEVSLLGENDFSSGNFAHYEVIITGVRAFNTLSWLQFAQDKFQRFVENGGIVVVQYNTDRGLLSPVWGPYPLQLSRDRVTEENSEVVFLLPDHPLLRYPNRIDAADFEGWVQERGLYFPGQADAAYERLFRMHDQGGEPLDKALLYARVGKGHYIYTGLSFFRELPAGVPGAIRLFVNMISHQDAPEMETGKSEAIRKEKK